VNNFPIELAQEKLRRTVEARATLIEEHSAAFRWLMASFLAINGGGLVALTGLEVSKGYFIAAGIAYWFGIICALGLAWRSQVINRTGIQKLAEIELIWKTALTVGELDKEGAEKADDALSKVQSFAARAFGWASVASFSVGTWVVGFGLI
jgi:hypothetical protein